MSPTSTSSWCLSRNGTRVACPRRRACRPVCLFTAVFGMSDWITVAALTDLMPGTRRIVDVDDVQFAVFNLNGEFYAIEDICTHDYAPLADARLEGDEIICPRHGARICINNGAVTAPLVNETVATLPERKHAE